MYYAIELFNKHDIIVKDVSDHLMEEILEELSLYKDRLKFNTPDGVMVTNHKISTYYLRDKEKRKKILNNLLSSENCFDNDSFVMSAISSNNNVINVKF
jgi:uncharacterized protein YxjI